MIQKFSLFAVAFAITFGLSASAANAQTIVEVAQSDDTFSSLVDAVIAADLADTLASEGPFTVFAPTNDGFAALPAYVVTQLERNPELLSSILLYHVAVGELISSEVVTMPTIETVNGEMVNVVAKDGGYYINNSQLTALDVMADNGVVHVIDQVLIPRAVYQAILDDLKMQLAEIEAMVAVFNN